MNRSAASRSRCTGAGGFTLLEVMAAVVILGIAVTPLLYGQAQAIRAQARTQNTTLATLKAMEVADWALMFRNELPMPGQSMEVPIDPPFDFLQATVRVEQNELVPAVSEVYVAVSWETGDARRPTDRGRADTGDTTMRVEICFYVTALQ